MRRLHLPEYLVEAAGLGVFMISAGSFATLIWHPESPASTWVTSEWIRRFMMGTAMGLTAITLIYSPWGRRSGAHFNPAVTLTMLRLRKMLPRDGALYMAAQFVGGLTGVVLTAQVARRVLPDPPVWYVPTVPGDAGAVAALGVELLMSAGLMLVVLATAESKRWAPFTGALAGLMLAIYITLAAPLSGMSINPARTVASAIPAGDFRGLWIYFVGPVAGMLLAVEAFRVVAAARAIRCCGLNHRARGSRVFQCAQTSQLREAHA